MENREYPRLVRACQIEVPSPRDGKPGYKWVQGWKVQFSATRGSTPERYRDARELLEKAKKEK